ADFNAIEQLLDTSRKADGIEETRTANDIAAFYNSVKHFNLAQDLFLVEYHDEVIAFAGTRWWEERGKNFIHLNWIEVHPDWRERGILKELLYLAQARARENAQAHTQDGTNWLQAFLSDRQLWAIHLFENDGYKEVRTFYEMVRPNLANLPDFELPRGIEVR